MPINKQIGYFDKGSDGTDEVKKLPRRAGSTRGLDIIIV